MPDSTFVHLGKQAEAVQSDVEDIERMFGPSSVAITELLLAIGAIACCVGAYHLFGRFARRYCGGCLGYSAVSPSEANNERANDIGISIAMPTRALGPYGAAAMAAATDGGRGMLGIEYCERAAPPSNPLHLSTSHLAPPVHGGCYHVDPAAYSERMSYNYQQQERPVQQLPRAYSHYAHTMPHACAPPMSAHIPQTYVGAHGLPAYAGAHGLPAYAAAHGLPAYVGAHGLPAYAGAHGGLPASAGMRARMMPTESVLRRAEVHEASPAQEPQQLEYVARDFVL